jgi:hypothetical protein
MSFIITVRASCRQIPSPSQRTASYRRIASDARATSSETGKRRAASVSRILFPPQLRSHTDLPHRYRRDMCTLFLRTGCYLGSEVRGSGPSETMAGVSFAPAPEIVGRAWLIVEVSAA